MKNYLAIFLGSPDMGKQMRDDNSEEMKKRMQEGMVAW